MAGGEDVSMIKSPKSKLDTIMNTLNALSCRITEIERFFTKIFSNVRLTAI